MAGTEPHPHREPVAPSPPIDWAPMSADEFAAWWARALPAYAQLHVKDGKWSAEEAFERAREEHEALLPEGRGTPGHHFRTLWRGTGPEREAVGVLWFAEVFEGGRLGAYVYDVEVSPAARRQGVARAAFARLEAHARELGLAFLGLHVFGWNTPARALYLELGFVETNVRMRKALRP